MKKFLIIAAAAALALTACQKVNKVEENLQDGFQEGFTGMEVRVPVSMDEGIQTKSFSYLDYDHRHDTQGYDWSPSFFNNDGTSTLMGFYSVGGSWFANDYYLLNTSAKPSYLEKVGDKCELVMNLSQAIPEGEGYSHFVVAFNAAQIGSGYYTSFASGDNGYIRWNVKDTYYQTDASASHLDGQEPIYAVGSIKCADGTPGQNFKFHHVASLIRFYVKNTGNIPITVSRVVLNNYDGASFDRMASVYFTDNTTTESVPEPRVEVTRQTPSTFTTVYCSDLENTGWNIIDPGEIATFYAITAGRTDTDLNGKSYSIEVYDQANIKIADKWIRGADIAASSGATHFQAGYAYNFSVKAVGKSFEVDGLNYTITSGTKVNVAAKSGGGYQQETISIPSSVTVNGVTYQVKGIGSSAFQRAPNLKSVTVAEGVVSVGAHAFTYCPLLEEIVFPSTLSDINNLNPVFSYSPKLSIRFSAENPNFHVDASGVLYSKDKKLYFLPPKLTGDYTVEAGTEVLVGHSIENPHFSSITIPASVRFWNGYVFCFSEAPEGTFRLVLDWTAEQLDNLGLSSSISSAYFRQYVSGTQTHIDKFTLDVPEGLVETYKAKDVFNDATYDSTGTKHFTWVTH